MSVEFAKILCRCLLAMQPGSKSEPKWYLMQPWKNNYTRPLSFSTFEKMPEVPIPLCYFHSLLPFSLVKSCFFLNSIIISDCNSSPLPSSDSLCKSCKSSEMIKLPRLFTLLHWFQFLPYILKKFQSCMANLSILKTGLLCFKKEYLQSAWVSSYPQAPSECVQLQTVNWHLCY